MFGIKRIKKLSSFQIILLGFIGVIIVGALLLMLPFATRTGEVASFLDALFTSTSAVCVTGLVVKDTAEYWSVFGQIIILLLIQIGGMGVVTIATAGALIAGRKIGLMQKSTMQEALSAPNVGGIVKLTSFIIKTTLLVELIGALLMMPVYCTQFGLKGVWIAIFHSVSAFCNAGFDLMGFTGEYSSLSMYVANPVINVVIMLLIIIGGIGFLTWNDVYTHKWHVKKYRMQSKVILVATGVLILLPTLYFFFFEFTDKPFGERLLASLFHAVTPRTAGFSTVDLTTVSEVGLAFTMLLMLIGGSPGSTAGGMKTTTVAVLFSSAVSVFRRNKNAHMMGRRISDETIKNASAILVIYVFLFFIGGALISAIEGLPLLTCLFETISAVGTVGLSLGITTSLGVWSRLILIALMFMGRIGGLTLIYATFGGTHKNVSKFPLEKIMVG